jgi:preprotein translocase subunit YajC
MTILKSIALAQAAQEGGGGSGTGSNGPGGFPPFLFLIIAMFAIMYFLTIRPTQKREKARQEMLAALSKGDHVVTNGGLHGTIVGLNDKSVVLRVSEDPPVKLEFVRGAVSQVQKDEGESKS